MVDTSSNVGNVCQLLTNGKVNNLPITTGKAFGIAQNSMGTVMLKGISNIHTGLKTGEKYYFNVNGILSADSIGTFVGVAISDAEIYIEDYIID